MSIPPAFHVGPVIANDDQAIMECWLGHHSGLATAT